MAELSRVETFTQQTDIRAFSNAVLHNIGGDISRMVSAASHIHRTGKAEIDKPVGKVQFLVDRISRRIEQALKLYQADASGYIKLNIQEHSPHAFVDDLKQIAIKYSRDLKHLAITSHIDPNVPSVWPFDWELLNLAVMNAVDNCLKYTQSSIDFTLCKEDNDLLLKITDNSGGYPDSILNTHITSLKDSQTGTVKTGTGLGLCFANMIANAHGNSGIVRLSNNGNQAIFTIGIPLNDISHLEVPKIGQMHIREFSNAILHDIKNDILIMLAATAAIKRTNKSELDTPIRETQFYAERISRGTNQALMLYKVDAGGHISHNTKTHHSACDLISMVAHTVTTYALDDVRQLKITAEAKDELVDYIGYFDWDMLYAAMMNAADNSFKYAQSMIHFEFDLQDGMLVFSIVDDSGGFPPHILNCDVNDFKNSIGTAINLQFANLVAKDHTNNGKSGFIRWKNQKFDEVTQAVIEIHIP